MGRKQPKAGVGIPDAKRVRVSVDAARFDSETLCWQVRFTDWDHPSWGWSGLPAQTWTAEIRDKFASFETMTWSELRQATGGKTYGTNHHSIPVSSLCKSARDRLTQLQRDDIDEVFSLRLTGTIRVYGYKDGRVFRVL
jgi:hypothetical protein